MKSVQKIIAYMSVGLLFLIAGCHHPEALYREMEPPPLEQGRTYEQKHEYAKAEQQYLRINDIIVRNMTLNQLSTAWDSVNANITFAQQMVNQQPHSAKHRLSLAEEYYKKGLLCSRYLKENVSHYPRDFVADEWEFFNAEALREARKALQLQPNSPEASLLIGEIYVANSRTNDALRELKHLIKKHPDFAKGYYAIGKIYFDTKEYSKVERYLIRAIKLDPNLDDGYYLLGKFYLEKRWLDYAAATFLEILRKNPKDAATFELFVASSYELGKYYMQQDQYDKAINIFQEIQRVKPSYDVHQSFLLAQKKREEALIKAAEAEAAEKVAEEILKAREVEREQPSAEKQVVAQLRREPVTLVNTDIVQMIREKGFNHPNNLSSWGLSSSVKGSFQHKYQGQSLKGANVVVDQATGLMWQQSGTPEQMTWKSAEEYVRQLNRSGYGGFSDWRLPTIEELASLLEFEKKDNNSYIDPAFDSAQGFCWSSDTVANANAAWAVAFHSGHVYYDPLDRGNYARAVR